MTFFQRLLGHEQQLSIIGDLFEKKLLGATLIRKIVPQNFGRILTTTQVPPLAIPWYDTVVEQRICSIFPNIQGIYCKDFNFFILYLVRGTLEATKRRCLHRLVSFLGVRRCRCQWFPRTRWPM